MVNDFSEQRARDSLAFEPLPDTAWLSLTESGIVIATRYSEPLSTLLRSLPGARWDASARCWRYPYTSAGAIRIVLPRINVLAEAAKEVADTESKRRKAERQALEAARIESDKARILAQRPRQLRQEYLSVVDGPRYALTIEAIGDDISKYAMLGLKRRHWVARIYAANGRGGWVRDFIQGHRDYIKANSIGSRGIQVTYFLERGPIYEVAAPLSWKSTDRFFCRIDDDGALVRLEDISECLEK